MKRLSLILIAVIVIIIGCNKNDNGPTQAEPVNYSVTFIGLVDTISAFENTEHDVNFQILITDDNQNPVVDKEVEISSALGWVSPAQGVTDSTGHIDVIYVVTVPLGFIADRIRVVVGTTSITEIVNLVGDQRPASILFLSGTTSIAVPEGSDAILELDAKVLDSRQQAIPFINVLFTLEEAGFGDPAFGSLDPDFQTDRNGTAHATYHSRGDFGRVTIRCRVNEGQELHHVTAQQVLTITRQGGSNLGGSIILTTNNDYIYADNGVTTTSVTALLRDDQGFVIPNQPIEFSANNNGVVQTPITTDGNGLARTTFRDIGVPSYDANNRRAASMIIGKHVARGIADTVFIDILPQPEAHHITLTTGALRLKAGSSDSMFVRAVVYQNAQGGLVPAGVAVIFEVDNAMGTFSTNSIPVNFGLAQTYFHPGDNFGNAVIRAKVRNPGGSVIASPDVTIEVYPEPPASVTMQANPEQLTAGDQSNQSVITARVYDAFNQPIEDHSAQIFFATSLGAISPQSAYTVNGVAQARLQPGFIPGTAVIRAETSGAHGAVTGTTEVEIVQSRITLELTATPPVVNRGGEGSVIRATLTDAFGAPVMNPTYVAFRIITDGLPPNDRPHFGNNNPFSPFVDTVLTNTGEASIGFTPGTLSNVYHIISYALTPNLDSTNSFDEVYVQVVSGDPANIAINVDPVAENAGGGAWLLEVSATVTDMQRFPANDGVYVYFSIVEEHASITNGMTGNQNRAGDTVPGVAFANLTYNSRSSFKPVTVVAYIIWDGEDSLGASRNYVLPLQQGRLFLNADPGNWLFTRDEGDTATIRVTATLRDGHQIQINDAPISFTSTRGRLNFISGRNPTQYTQYFLGEAIRLTGPQNDGETVEQRDLDDDMDGQAVVWLRGTEVQFFQGLNDDDNTIVVQVDAEIEGYELDVEPVEIEINRRE